MSSSIRVRAFEAADYAAVAGLLAAAPAEERQDFEPRSEEDLRAFDASFDPERYVLRRYIAEDVAAGKIVAQAHFFHMPWLFDPAHYWCAVRCDPAYRRRGIGAALYNRVMEDLTARGANTIRMMAREEAPEIAAVLERRGFREALRSWTFELDTGALGSEIEAKIADKKLAPGVMIAPLPEVRPRDPRCLDELLSLYNEVMRDVPLPGPLRINPPIEWLEHYLEGGPASLPEACLIARDGEKYLGLCILHKDEEDPSTLEHLLTGVSAKSRGLGVGVALKIASIDLARRLGYHRIRTCVESNNPRMLAINEAFGFVRRGGLIVFEAKLGR